LSIYGESSTDGVLWERISQQTFFECLFNVKCNKCWGGWEVEQPLFQRQVLSISINEGKRMVS